MYDDIWWNDVKYLYNKDIFMEDVMPQIVRTVKGEEAEGFSSGARVGPHVTIEQALAGYDRQEKQNKDWTQEEEKTYYVLFRENLEKNVLQVIEENPDVEFYLFFPPYSICWWDSQNQKGPNRIKHAINMEEIAIEEILKYDNVRLFSFFNNYDIVCDLRNYTDEVHFTDNVSTEILKYIKNGEYELTKSNYKAYIAEITDFYCNYDYDSIFE